MTSSLPKQNVVAMNVVARGFATDGKRNIATDTTNVMNMVETAAICQRNMFSEIKITIECNT